MNEQIAHAWWVTPVATLIAAALGGLLPLITAIWIFERQVERENFGSLALRSEKLIQSIADTSKAIRVVINEIDESQMFTARSRTLQPAIEPLTDAKYVVIHMMNEASDEKLRICLRNVFSSINRIEETLGDLCAIDTRDIDAYIEVLNNLCFAQNSINTRISQVVERISELRGESEKRTFQRLRDLVRSA